MIFVSSIKEYVVQLSGPFCCQIPFENLYFYTVKFPSELQVGFEIRRIYPDEVLAPDLLLMKNAITTPGSQNRTGRSGQTKRNAEW